MIDFVAREYQGPAIDLALNNEEGGCYLAMEPGSGKSVVALTVTDILQNDRWAVDCTLIVGTKLVAQEVFQREAVKWRHTAHLEIYEITAADFDYKRSTVKATVKEGKISVTVDRVVTVPSNLKNVRSKLLARPERIFTISSDHLWWLVKAMGSKWPFRLVIGDEATLYKRHSSKRSKALRFLRTKGLIEYLVLMSGTPQPRNLEDWFNPIRMIDGGKRLGATLTEFREKFMVPDARNKDRVFSWKAREGATEEVISRIADICLAVKADSWRETEPPDTVQRLVKLPPKAMESYLTMERDYILEFPEAEAVAPMAAALTGKLLQIASGAVLDTEKAYHVLHDAKLDALEELIRELDGEPLVVGYWYTSSLDRLKKRFPKLVTSRAKGFIDAFGKREIPLLALHPSSAAHGLDGLQHGGHHVAIFDLWHDWEKYWQLIARLDRSGQKRRVRVHQLIAENTIDLHVAEDVLAERGSEHHRVMNALQRRKALLENRR